MIKIPSFRYEIIIKLESIDEDMACVLEWMKLSKIITSVDRVNLGPRGASEDQVQDQFRTLTKNQIRALYEHYKYDFIAFEYDFQSFLDLGIDVWPLIVLQLPTSLGRERRAQIQL